MTNSIAKPLSRLWLLLGVAALGIAGLFSLVLVVARTPALASIPGFAGFFHEALVVHVDLSVLVWFLCIACLMWSSLAKPSRPIIPYLEEAALICFALGTLCITLSPIDSKGVALMSNYIPVITSVLFFLGLALIFCGVAFMIVRVVTAKTLSTEFSKPIQFGIFSSALITAVSLAAFFWSYHQMPGVIEGQQYYELLFWGGGHVLQFTHTQILLVCWLMLAGALGHSFTEHNTLLIGLFAIGVMAMCDVPRAYIGVDVASFEHREAFTHLMILGNGLAPTVLAFMLLAAFFNTRKEPKSPNRALRSALMMSVLLFLYGGALGGMIRGQNVIIPAHYHGSIVGVTIGFMGLAYLLLPKFGYRDVTQWKLSYWQPIVYGGGQLMHISGLAWSGGYGVLRKTPGGMADLAPSVKAALGFMGAGGLLAIIGGFMFVIVVIRAVRR